MKKSHLLLHHWATETLAAVDPIAQEQLIHGLRLLRDTLAEAPTVKRTLSNEKVSIEARLDLVGRALGDLLSPPLRTLLETILREHALERLSPLIDQLIAIRDRHGVAREVMVMTAVPLDTAERKTLRETLEKKWETPVILNERLDPALIGGLQLRTNDWYFDGSVEGRTKRLAQALIGS